MLALKDIEDALIADVKANITGVKTCETHEKEFDQLLVTEMRPRTPFVLIRYGGTDPDENERRANGASGINSREFYLAAGSESLRSRKEAQRGNYDLLDDLRARYDGMSLAVGSDSVTLAYKGDRLLFSENSMVVYAMVLGWTEA